MESGIFAVSSLPKHLETSSWNIKIFIRFPQPDLQCKARVEGTAAGDLRSLVQLDFRNSPLAVRNLILVVRSLAVVAHNSAAVVHSWAGAGCSWAGVGGWTRAVVQGRWALAQTRFGHLKCQYLWCHLNLWTNISLLTDVMILGNLLLSWTLPTLWNIHC